MTPGGGLGFEVRRIAMFVGVSGISWPDEVGVGSDVGWGHGAESGPYCLAQEGGYVSLMRIRHCGSSRGSCIRPHLTWMITRR